MGCQTEIAAAIRQAGADYVLAVKDNQPTLHATLIDAFVAARRSGLRRPVAATLDDGEPRARPGRAARVLLRRRCRPP